MSVSVIQQRLAPVRERVVGHAVYEKLGSLDALRVFMEHHVFAVWDFMSLLKALQRRLTCVDVPWLPVGDAQTRRLINEIVLGEESDMLGDGRSASHYEMYLAAMQPCGADARPVETLVAGLGRGLPLAAALDGCAAPAAARQFVSQTWSVIERGNAADIAAAFAFGREELIPSMFRVLVADAARAFPDQLALYCEYLERHIDLDESSHTPLALRMVSALCGDDDDAWRAAGDAAEAALEARIALWDGVAQAIDMRAAEPAA